MIKASLFSVSPTIPNNVNWEKVFVLAKTQCVVQLIASYVPNDYRPEWRNIEYQSKAHYMQMLYEQNQLIKLLDENKIPYVILKGTAAAKYYPVPSLRTFGDVDFYVANDFFDTAVRLLQNNNYRFISNNDRQYAFEKNGVEFELHKRISRQGNFIDNTIQNNILYSVNCSIDKCSFLCLPKYENGLVLLWHIMHHLQASGIGFRQIIDWMMFVHKELDDSSWNNQFRPLAAQAGLEKLAIIVTYMCKKWLGLPDDITWCNTADEETSDQLLARILYDGNFGAERSLFENVKFTASKEGIFRYLQRTGMTTWVFAQKHSVFRPFAWIYQLFRLLFQGVSGLIKGRRVFRKNKHLVRLNDFLKKLK